MTLSVAWHRWYRSALLPVLLLALGGLVCVLSNQKVYDIRTRYVAETISEFGQLETPMLQAASLEFKGVVSDYLFLKTMTFMGIKIAEKKNPGPDEWQLVYQMLQRITDLDPRFWDPYVFAEMMLAWQAGMFAEAEALLEKATEHRPGDYRPHYYMGFNQLYFKKDPAKAAPHLRRASQFPRSPTYIKALASRVSLYADQTGTGIFFLEDLIKETSDPKMVRYFEKRLLAMKTIFYLEEKVKEYTARNGHAPNSLNDLITAGILAELPRDPYGGNFFLLQNGRVYTTSKMVDS